MQYKFDNDTIADCVLFAPEPLGVIAIDSKFPLENYQNMVDKTKDNIVKLWCYVTYLLTCANDFDAHTEMADIESTCSYQLPVFIIISNNLIDLLTIQLIG